MPYRASAPLTREWRHFDVALDDRVLTVTFTRPDRLNALTFDVYADLRDLLTEVEHHDDVEVVLLTGTGRGFCSGGDVEEIIGALVAMEPRELLEFTRMTGAVVQRLREVPLPVVAGVNGTAAGAGAVIALASDFRVCARSASFRFLFTKVGLSGADMGATWLLPRVVGLGRATEILFLGERVDAEEAHRIGLATTVVDDADLPEAARALARRLADGPTLAHRVTKSLLHREGEISLAAAIETDALAQALLMQTADHREFHAAFTQKRPPQWKGR